MGRPQEFEGIRFFQAGEANRTRPRVVIPVDVLDGHQWTQVLSHQLDGHKLPQPTRIYFETRDTGFSQPTIHPADVSGVRSDPSQTQTNWVESLVERVYSSEMEGGTVWLEGEHASPVQRALFIREILPAHIADRVLQHVGTEPADPLQTIWPN